MKRILTGALVAVSALAATAANATVTFTGTGLTPENSATASASAAFTISGSTLTLILANTSANTAAQGDLLTGVVFSIGGTQTLALAASQPTVPAGSTVFTSSSTSNAATPVAGSYTSILSAPTATREFGVATTGFNGLFSAAGITLGNGGPDYGIAGAAFASNIAQYPIIKSSLQFVFNITSGSAAEGDIANVGFLFGTAGGSLITGCNGPCPIPNIPEPSTWALMLAGLGLFGFMARRRARS